jgi:ProP effector
MTAGNYVAKEQNAQQEKTDERPSYEEVCKITALLAERWPQCFAIKGPRRRPLKIGITEDVFAALGETISLPKLRHVLAAYCSNKKYRAHLVTGAVRIDLDGAPAGTVTAQQAQHAGRSTKNPPAPKRLSLADLKAAAAARRKATEAAS